MPSYHRISSTEQAVQDSGSPTSAFSSSSSLQSAPAQLPVQGRPTTGTGSSRTWSERIQDKALALAWVLLALLVAYLSNFWTVITLQQQPTTATNTTTTTHEDETNKASHYSTAAAAANRPVMQLAAICIAINMVLAAYLLLYLPYIKGLTDSSAWSVYCPRVMPIMVVVGLAAFVLLVRGTWPVWGFLAPLVVGLQILGAIFATQFIPWWWPSSSSTSYY